MCYAPALVETALAAEAVGLAVDPFVDPFADSLAAAVLDDAAEVDSPRADFCAVVEADDEREPSERESVR